MKEWTTTALWELLEQDSSAEATRAYITAWLNDVQTILAKGGTAPLDFTLHDDEHSFRVAERMAELIPEATLEKLSDFEIGLLLMSAYLHDIGMNPRRALVGQVRDYLLSGNVGSLDQDEAVFLQRWLDQTRPGVQPPVGEGKPDTQRLREAEFLTAHFSRYRHNDWSEKFIQEKAKGIEHVPYATWVPDLIALCKSHHFGLQALMEEQFNLRIAGRGNKLINLRYLAALLRVADVLEFDPERTPDVIFSHRSIDPRSQIFWYKDHNIVLALNEQNRKVLMSARTSDAWTHRAVLDTANDVDLELQNCADIADQNGFLRGVQLDNVDHYIWPWPRQVTRDIVPQPNSFDYIEGAFRPDANRILSLLAGTQLYETPFAAIRELLQNSFDAVKEQTAVEEIQIINSGGKGTKLSISALQRVKLSIVDEADGLWVVCVDTGIGMTRRTIESHLLVSGSKPARKCWNFKDAVTSGG